MAQEINARLPEDIRVVNVFKVSKSFDGRRHCDKRTYDYLLPLRLLVPEPGSPRHHTKVIGDPDGWQTGALQKLGLEEGFVRHEYYRHCNCHRRAGGPPASFQRPWAYYLTG